MSAQTAADLRAAADILERDGWRQGDYGTISGCKCAYGALHYVASGGATTDEPDDYDQLGRADSAAQALATHLGLDGGYPRIPDWNDQQGRTSAEVIAALRSAADRADAPHVDAAPHDTTGGRS